MSPLLCGASLVCNVCGFTVNEPFSSDEWAGRALALMQDHACTQMAPPSTWEASDG